MMEDKYNELVADGKSDNEAVGTVISEFGNLDEISEELGIHNIVINKEDMSRRNVTMEEAKLYLHEHIAYAYKIALGVFLCITSPVGVIFNSAFNISDALGTIFLMCAIAAAVFLFVYSSITMHRWDFLKDELCSIDFLTTNYVNSQKEKYIPTYALTTTIGIVLCVICFVPVIIFDETGISFHGIDMEFLGVIALFLLVATGVFMIVLSQSINSSYNNLLKLNSSSTVSGNYVPSQHPETKYITSAAATVMSVFWPTITCFYLIWSFLSFDWWCTWIIWPIAAIIHTILNTAFKKQ